MWQLRRSSTGTSTAVENELLQSRENRLDDNQRSTSQNILEIAQLQHAAVAFGSHRQLEKSHSLPVVNRHGSFGANHRSHGVMLNDTFGNFSTHPYQARSGSEGNPFLDHSISTMQFPAGTTALGSLFAAASSNNHITVSAASSTASSKKFTTSRSSEYSASFSDEDLPRQLLHHSKTSSFGTANLRTGSGSGNIKTDGTSTTQHVNNSGRNSCQIGPSKLYRLIAAPCQDASLNWDEILQRSLSHPHEACFFDPNAGGHVFALHRLLRRTGPPFDVVEAVMKACPRAVTRKQAVAEEDNIVDVGNNSLSNIIDGQPPQHEHPIGDNDNDAASQARNDVDDHDDVRFEYPLAIACEWEQDKDIIRLLASSLKDANPVYRSEVLRSLDYASLPNMFVRVLLEENPHCVMERGTSSEENEGDDDDSPLEQLLFWWDDPDMLGIEDDIATYPECDMKNDLRDLYDKLRMMLYAATKGSMNGYDENREQFQVLHHVLRIATEGINKVRYPNDFAHAVLLIAKFIQRERVSMFRERDASGSLPLHIACSGQGLIRPNSISESDNNTEAVVDDTEQIDNDSLNSDGDDDLMNDEQALDQSDDEEEDNEAVEIGSDRISLPPGMKVIDLLLEHCPNSIKLRDSLTGSLPIHLALQCNPQVVEVIDKFIGIFPLSISMPDGNGRLPLHSALLQKSPSWENILSSYPAALECRDPVSGLLPFQLAAMSTEVTETDDNTCDEVESMSICFKLLRKNPCLAIGLGKNKSRPQSLIEQQIMARYKPRVIKLEEENVKLQQRIKELEQQLESMKAITTEYPQLKKRKSSTHQGQTK